MSPGPEMLSAALAFGYGVGLVLGLTRYVLVRAVERG